MILSLWIRAEPMNGTSTRTVSESTNMNTNINTIGWQILVQTLIRYGSFIAIAWLILSFLDVWVSAYIAKV